MKTFSIFGRISLGLLVAGSIAACNQNKSAAPAASKSATASGEPNKELIVYVNSDTLLSKYEYAKDVQNKLTVKGKNAQSDLESKGQAFQREVAEYQKAQASLSADQRQATEQRLQREQQQLQSYQQNATAQFQNDRSTEDAKLYDKIAEYVKGYAKEKGYKLVLTYSKANPTVLYGDPTLDVTTEVLTGLNEDYKKAK